MSDNWVQPIPTEASQPFFTQQEMADIRACALERGSGLCQLVHDVVMEDLHR